MRHGTLGYKMEVFVIKCEAIYSLHKEMSPTLAQTVEPTELSLASPSLPHYLL